MDVTKYIPEVDLGIKSRLKKSTVGKKLVQAWDRMEESASPIKGETTQEIIDSLSQYFNLSAENKARVQEHAQKPKGEELINLIKNETNRHASHRRAFMVNLPVQFTLVDVTSFNVLGVYFLGLLPSLYLKAASAAFDGYGIYRATRSINGDIKRAMLEGPNQPPKKTWLGMITGGNRKRYNRYQKGETALDSKKLQSEGLYKTIHAKNIVAPVFGANNLVMLACLIGNGRYFLWSNRNRDNAQTERGNKLDKLKL
ncbi:MAG: hypothetical protein MRY79_01340 [Alphaproteobacteria bacterium]|nr:hypothetical protein [Alphaproteobacteria bacterium]